ncbi:sensor histidine kinase [Burkholderia multivorans]|uniref:sensor histidine kinase n=1 Tax=Burkholderia multivorans TaxID=87883 RepID=UPI0021BED480|nr:PAS domain S-box protein [Burkholderia multivorans]
MSDNTYFPHSEAAHATGMSNGAGAPGRFAQQRWRVLLPFAAIGLIVAGAFAAPLLAMRFERAQRHEQLISDTLWAQQSLGFEAQRLAEAMQIVGTDLAADPAPDLFMRRAAELLQRSPEVVVLCRLERALAAMQCFPGGREGAAISHDAAAAEWRDTAERARRLGRPVASLADARAGTPRVALLVVPTPGGSGRAMAALVSIERLLTATLPWWFAHENAITLTDPRGDLIAVHDPRVEGRGVYTHRIEVGFADQTFYLEANSTRGPPYLVPNLLSGAVAALSLLLAWSVWRLWRDLVRRARAEYALREQQALRQAMEDSLVSGLRTRDLDGRITYVNAAFCEMVGYRADELIGCAPPMPYWAPEFSERSSQRHAQLLSGTLPRHAYESVFLRRDGERLTVLINEAPLRDGTGRQVGWTASIVDISEQKRTQELQRTQNEQLHHMSRVMTMGEMASALAHELNQPLAAANSYCTAALNLMTGEAPQDDAGGPRELLAKGRHQVERAGQIIRRVQQFVRKTTPSLGPVAPDAVITGLLPLVQLQTSRSGERVDTMIEPALPPVLADRVLLEQVLLNLTRNAFDAMAHLPASERIVLIRAERIAASEGDPAVVRIGVRDRGRGLPDDARDALERPFFTTKPDGMGMGIAVCRSALETMHSRLRYAPSGDGACFYFDLRITEESCGTST